MTRFRTATAGAFALAAGFLMGPLLAAPALAQEPSPAPAQAAPAPVASRLEGTLQVIWADPKDHADHSEEMILFSLNAADGKRTPLDVAPELQSRAILSAGKQVTVVGSPVAGLAAGQERVAATSIEPSAASSSAEGADAEQQAAVRGTKKVLYVLLKFKGDAQEPFKPAHYLNITNPMAGSGKIPATINGFYDAVSYGKFKWTGSVAGNKWYTLPNPHSFYCGGGLPYCPKLEQAGDEALKMIAKDVDVTKFNSIAYVFNNDLNCCAYGGPGYIYKGKSFGVTWQPPWGQAAGIYAHELGHSLGLPHSGWRYGTYDSNHDQMSRGAVAKLVACSSYNSINEKKKMTIFCDEPGGGYIMGHQIHLGWIPAANKATLKTKGVKTYDIEANAKKLGKALKVVVVCIQGSVCNSADPGGRFLTIEVKNKLTKFDRGVPSEGVIIHDVAMARGPISGPCYVNPQTGWAMPFDATPGDWDPNTCQGEGLRNMAYKPGQSLTIDEFGIKVEVLSRTKDVYKVRVTKLR